MGKKIISENHLTYDIANPLEASAKLNEPNSFETKRNLNDKVLKIGHKGLNLENMKTKAITSTAFTSINKHIYDAKSANYTSTVVPEILNGLNISDFLEKDIEIKMKNLEQEHEKLTYEWQSYIERTSPN